MEKEYGKRLMQWTLPIEHSWRSRTMAKYVSGSKAAICGTPDGDKEDWKGEGAQLLHPLRQ